MKTYPENTNDTHVRFKHTFPHPTRLHLVYPDQEISTLPLGTLRRVISACCNSPLTRPNLHLPTSDVWEGALAIFSQDDQLRLVERALESSRAQGVLE
ncbi:hypothetical protein HPB50_000662 [Hyalomma asiaticum]|uniref:Uncharacterized protein n=1 Tax=Hyalomma asiaticum TaxID=266040 RepID=A0ACB7T722_HYAAI|nr:hypothetical protein HPB50_000662 [Hyalomma asiaticum]